MVRAKKIFLKTRVVILLVSLLLALIAINPQPWAHGVAVRTVALNSSAYIAGMRSPSPNVIPTRREAILEINGRSILDLADYYNMTKELKAGQHLIIKTTKKVYNLKVKPKIRVDVLNETEKRVVQQIIQVNETINGSTVRVNKTINRTVIVNKTRETVIGVEELGLKVYPRPQSNIKKGLDLQGGTRVLMEPKKRISPQDLDLVISNLKERLNVYGLSDVVVAPSKDLEGNQYIVVEIAGANEEEVKSLLSKQGKFEAKISNATIFRGGGDILYVARSATEAGIDPRGGCGKTANGWACRFRFGITLSPKAAQRQANATKNLGIIKEGKEEFLDKKIDLYLDDVLVDSLNIGVELRGRPVTDIAISGSGTGTTQQEAIANALKNMKRLQTILITGSLPVKLKIVKTDTISPILGESFVKNSTLVGLIAILAVSLTIFLRYHRLKISIPLALISLSEVVLLLGLAALIGWNLDQAAIAGIIIAVGTGVDDQIVITDEALGKETSSRKLTLKQKIKNAFFIIMGSYATTVVAILPLWFAGAGLLKGFAITTIFGVTFGVFITRPAYAAIIEELIKEEKD